MFNRTQAEQHLSVVLRSVSSRNPVEIVNSVKISVDINRFFAKNVFRMPGIGKQTNNPLIVFEILWLICQSVFMAI